MARFVFRLQPALDLRRRQEQTGQRALAERLRDGRVLREELFALNRDLVRSQDDLRRGNLTGTLDTGYLAAHRRYTIDVSRRGQELLRRIALNDKLAADARGDLALLTRRRRAIERLRDNARTEFIADEAGRELREADDASARWLASAVATEADA